MENKTKKTLEERYQELPKGSKKILDETIAYIQGTDGDSTRDNLHITGRALKAIAENLDMIMLRLYGESAEIKCNPTECDSLEAMSRRISASSLELATIMAKLERLI
ncbi:MAG: hypothetical protein ACRC1P_09970 [Cellulosilyticaceae bacterium]